MRVVATSRVEVLAAREPHVREALSSLASGGEVVFLSRLGVRDLSRSLSAAETDAVRRCLAGRHRAGQTGAKEHHEVAVGYVFGARLLATSRSAEAKPVFVAVRDYADLTYKSPLRGPNRDDLGPRFPVMAGVFRPQDVMAACPEAIAGDLAEIRRIHRPTPFEIELLHGVGFSAVTDELANVAILARHLGYQVLALAVCKETGRTGE